VFVVPEKFNRNNPTVRAMGPPAETGLRLLEYVCQRIGIASLAGLDMLDFGCGSRFTDAIVNRSVPLKSYVGIDVYKEMIDFLAEHAKDPRLEFLHINARNLAYNKEGVPLSVDTILPICGRKFDIVCMYSVITHQLPDDAAVIFTLLRKHVRDDGRLFFSAAIEDGDFGYREQFPENPTGLSVYSTDLMTQLIEAAGWRMLSFAPRVPGGLPNQETILCTPT
jgi:SAM-dependent methyltransferase